MKYKVSEQKFDTLASCLCKNRDFLIDEGQTLDCFQCLECGGFFMKGSR